MTSIQSLSVGTYEITLDLIFDGDMREDAELTNSANYTFNYGMYTRKVDVVNSRQLTLWVENFYEQSSFTLTISERVLDVFTNPLVGRTTTVSPYYSVATISNYNGLIRTSHSGKNIAEDSQRIYAAGSKGIDVLKKENRTANRTWAQIFDGYSVNTMFVANFPNDLVITDTVSPYITTTPPDGGTMFPESHIIISISDLTTAVELSSVTIYVGNQIAFKGDYGGWQNEFFGQIVIGYKTIDFEVWPQNQFVEGDEVTVRVITWDLLNNALDTSYTFEIVTSTAATKKWGIDEFGVISFGGV